MVARSRKVRWPTVDLHQAEPGPQYAEFDARQWPEWLAVQFPGTRSSRLGPMWPLLILIGPVLITLHRDLPVAGKVLAVLDIAAYAGGWLAALWFAGRASHRVKTLTVAFMFLTGCG